MKTKKKSLVDADTFLHSEEDPRYRGAAIPSKAFKLLQNMTDGGGQFMAQGNDYNLNLDLTKNKYRKLFFLIHELSYEKWRL